MSVKITIRALGETREFEDIELAKGWMLYMFRAYDMKVESRQDLYDNPEEFGVDIEDASRT